MQPFRSRRNSVSTCGIVAGLTAVLLLSGCPVAQVPNVPTDTDQPDTSSPTSNNNRRDQNRPIPPVPIDTDDGTSGGGGTGGTGGGSTDGGGAGTSGQPISVVVTAPNNFDINILPGGEGFATYEVFGGKPEDGAIAVELFIDRDGIADTGDEEVRKTGLATRGQERFATGGLAPGVYRIAIRAANRADSRTTYATGRLVIVGEAGLTFNQPNANARVRPGAAVAVQISIQSLAATVSWTVFTDVDLVQNGNEVTAFTGGGLSVNGSISTNGFAPGTYFIGLTVVDSAGQTKTEYFRDAFNVPREIVVDLAPAVAVTSPTGNQIVTPGDIVTVNATASDPEGAAEIRIFRDVDAVFNNNEVVLAGPFPVTSSSPQPFSVAVDTATLPAGTFRFGAIVTDGVGAPVSAYAPGSIRINAAPTVTVTAPAADAVVQSGAFVTVTWNASDLEGRIQTTQVFSVPDADNNGQPDRAPDFPADVVGTAQVGQSSFLFDTTPFIGPRFVGVRVIDDVNATAVGFAPGRVIVLNEAPTVVVEEPQALDAVRPAANNLIELRFIVGDRERGLVPQTANPPGIQVVVYQDFDNDLQPDSPTPVLTQSRNFYRTGLNTDVLNSTAFLAPGVLNAGGFGRFLLGVVARDQAGNVTQSLVPFLVDSVRTQIDVLDPVAFQERDRIGSLNVSIRTTDTSNAAVVAFLDRNIAPLQGNEILLNLVDAVPGANPGEIDWTFGVELTTVPAGLYHLYVVTLDLIDLDVVEEIAWYYPADAPQIPRDLIDVRVRDRLIGTLNLTQLDVPPAGQPPLGVVLRGFNFNDLAGSSMERVPDVNGDGIDEVMFGSRFAKANLVDLSQSIGFGEGYLIYGTPTANRLGGIRTFNAVGRGNIPGLIFPGIRAALGRVSDGFIGTEGLADFTILDDMDGDGLPDFVFSFPRVESVSLSVENPLVQDPSLRPDIPGMGSLEFNAWDDQNEAWSPNVAQFTRGGVVIVSSHNLIIQNPILRNRKNDRALDLHEVGQLFAAMSAPQLRAYQRPLGANCNPMELNSSAVDGVTACGADPDICPQQGQPQFAQPSTGTDPPLAGNGACCVPLMDCQVMTAAACAQAGGVYSERSPCDGTTCGQEQTWEEWRIRWDMAFNNQGPGGFHMPWTLPAADPPLANPKQFPWAPAPMRPPAWFPDHARMGNECGVPPDCFWTSEWYDWAAASGDMKFPCTNEQGMMMNTSWLAPDGASAAWTGFYGPTTSIREDAIGARVLGQSLNDHFGTSISTEGIWLFASAPDKTARQVDVPILSQAGGNRPGAGVIHQLRVDSRATSAPGAINKAQLWMERTYVNSQGQAGTLIWPEIDAEFPPTGQSQQGELTGRVDFTMPVPHQYIIESGGSLRGDDRINGQNQQNPRTQDYQIQQGTPNFCPAAPTTNAGALADFCSQYLPYPVDTAGYHVQNRPQQIVGPHDGAKIAHVQGVGDMNADGLRDFAVGSTDVKATFISGTFPNANPVPHAPTGDTIGAVFLVYSRPTGVQGDYLLERLALNANDVRRLNGIYLKGVPGAPIGRAFGLVGDIDVDDLDDDGATTDTIRDFNGDGAADLIVGSEMGNGGTGEVIVLLGSTSGNLASPEGGWTFDDAVAAEKAIRFRGVQAGDLAGANVSFAGDVDGDGLGDILIAAPGARDPADPARRPGVVYLVYGSSSFAGGQSYNLADVGVLDATSGGLIVPGIVFVGRLNNDALGGGQLAAPVNPNPPATLNPAGTPPTPPILSRGVASIGDIDGDGLGDYAISAMLGDLSDNPNERKTNAGEVYILYGKGEVAP